MALPFHPVPKPQPTLDRIRYKRDREQQARDFRAAVIARDGLVCRCCGRRVVKCLDVQANRCEVHHLRKRSTHPADKFNPDYGVVTCLSCHVVIERRQEIEQVGDEQSIVTFIRREP